MSFRPISSQTDCLALAVYSEIGAVKANTVLLPPPSRSPSPDLLDSDDEGTTPSVPLTLRQLPRHFPSLPPKHTYMKTPVRSSLHFHPNVLLICLTCRSLDIPTQESGPSIAGEEVEDCRARTEITPEPFDSHGREHEHRRRRATRAYRQLGDGSAPQEAVEGWEVVNFTFACREGQLDKTQITIWIGMW